MGLAGAEVDAPGLERLIGHGTDPRDGHGLGRSYSPDNDNVVAGFGLTFSPPLCEFGIMVVMRVRDYAEQKALCCHRTRSEGCDSGVARHNRGATSKLSLI